MPDQPKPTGPSPLQPPQPGQAGQAQPSHEDHELIEYLKAEEGHTDESAKQELKHNPDGVKARHKKHKEQHK